MSALCLLSASCFSVGSAEAELEPLLALDDALVLFVVAVALAAEVDWVAAVAVWTAGACGWKASTPAVPATVAARTMGERRIGLAPALRKRRTRSGWRAWGRRRAGARRRASATAHRARTGRPRGDADRGRGGRATARRGGPRPASRRARRDARCGGGPRRRRRRGARDRRASRRAAGP